MFENVNQSTLALPFKQIHENFLENVLLHMEPTQWVDFIWTSVDLCLFVFIDIAKAISPSEFLFLEYCSQSYTSVSYCWHRNGSGKLMIFNDCRELNIVNL